jgi:hypothetical protein
MLAPCAITTAGHSYASLDLTIDHTFTAALQSLYGRAATQLVALQAPQSPRALLAVSSTKSYILLQARTMIAPFLFFHSLHFDAPEGTCWKSRAWHCMHQASEIFMCSTRYASLAVLQLDFFKLFSADVAFSKQSSFSCGNFTGHTCPML